tara:strand:+ start:214 stop:435 length:222 start_codon:yes stop_codon:yes gene_type:complete
MSTTPIDTWAVDLANVTVIYPWVGSEVVMASVGIIAWLAWHVWQVKHENSTYDENLRKYGGKETINSAIDDHQ